MFLVNPSRTNPKRKRKVSRKSRKTPAWLKALSRSNPSGESTMARRRTKRRRSGRRKMSRSKRSAAARKAARTRKRNKAKRSAAGRKAARTRRRNAGRRRNPAKRRNPIRRRRRATGRRRSTRRRRNPSIVRSTTASIRSLTRPKTWTGNMVAGLQLGAGYAGVNALRAIEGRFGIDGLMASLPGGIVRTLAEYGLKIVNIGLTTQIAGFVVKGKSKTNVQYGGLANLGVQLLGDVSVLFGGTGEIVRGYLGDYNLAMGGQSMAPALGNYNLAIGGQAMPSVSGQEVYSPFNAVY